MVVYLYLWGKTINKLATDRKKIMLNKKEFTLENTIAPEIDLRLKPSYI